MADVTKETEQGGAGSAISGKDTIVETVARKVGSTIGTIASKVSGASGKSGNAHENRKYQIKKKKKAAHRRRLKASNTKG